MNYILLNTNEFNGTQKGVNVFGSTLIKSGAYKGKFATSENALGEFPEIFENLEYEIVELDAMAFQVDYTPPSPSGYKLLIPDYWETLFPDDMFVIGEFQAQLERKEGALVVDIAYLQWADFRAELLKPENATLARQMGAIMRYLEAEAIAQNFV